MKLCLESQTEFVFKMLPPKFKGSKLLKKLTKREAEERFGVHRVPSRDVARINRLSVEAEFPWTNDFAANNLFQQMHAAFGLDSRQRKIADLELMRLNEASHDVANDRMSFDEMERAKSQRGLLKPKKVKKSKKAIKGSKKKRIKNVD